jgi:hypothetical protein
VSYVGVISWEMEVLKKVQNSINFFTCGWRLPVSYWARVDVDHPKASLASCWEKCWEIRIFRILSPRVLGGGVFFTMGAGNNWF